MTIRKLTKDGAFTPGENETLASAFETTLQKLSSDHGDPLAHLIAKEMIATLRDDERDPEEFGNSAHAAVGLDPTGKIIRRRCPILIEFKGEVVKSDLFASDVEQPANISMKIRDKGWKPFRVRFDDANSAWVVSTLAYR